MADLKRGTKWVLFLSSYIPLFAILSVKHWSLQTTIPETGLPVLETLSGATIPVLSVGWLFIALVSFIGLLMVINLRKSKGGQDFKSIDSFRRRDELITTYVLVYIFPFVVLDYSILTNWVAFVLFFLLIGFIQVRSNQLYVNPILALFDYRIYEADTGDQLVTLVAKGGLEEPVDSIRTVELSNDVHMAI